VAWQRAGVLHAATPMIHVADVRATAAWYEGIGFTVLETYDDGADGLSFAILAAGATRVMFNQGGRPSAERRRESYGRPVHPPLSANAGSTRVARAVGIIVANNDTRSTTSTTAPRISGS
jgi:hypothetical protein